MTGAERAALSYGALWTSVSSTAHALAARVSPGERVLLLLPTGIDYIVSFLGCLGAAACAVPALPAQGISSQAQRALAIARAAKPRLAIIEAHHAHAYVGEVRVSASHELIQGGDYAGLAVSEA